MGFQWVDTDATVATNQLQCLLRLIQMRKFNND